MRTSTIAAMVAGSVFITGATYASDNDLKEHCEEYQAQNGGTADCECLANKASESVISELLKAETPDDLASLSAEALETVEKCEPQKE